jgi:hypothetical protein
VGDGETLEEGRCVAWVVARCISHLAYCFGRFNLSWSDLSFRRPGTSWGDSIPALHERRS